MGFLTRDVMLEAENYAHAKQMLTKTELLAPAYFILGGLVPGDACVITRSRTEAVDVWEMADRWFLLETNYDHWKDPLVIDDRRTPGMKCMNKIGSDGMGFKGLFNVLSTRSVLNKVGVGICIAHLVGRFFS